MKTLHTLSLVTLIAGAAVGSARAAGKPAPVRFSTEVLPVLRHNCGCHTAPRPPAGFSMNAQKSLFAGGKHGRAVVPGKSADSTIVKYVTGISSPRMPPGGTLAPATVALIRRWIDEGAKVDAWPEAGAKKSAGKDDTGAKKKNEDRDDTGGDKD